MARNSGNPQTAGTGRFGGLTQAIPWLWGIDVIAEVIGEFRGKTTKETKIDDVVLMVLKVGLLLLVSPFGLAFFIPAGLAWRLGFANPLKIGVFAEVTLIVFVGYLVRKKLSRDPWSRAYTQAKLAHKAKPDLEPDALTEKVRKALGQDERAARLADDAVRRVLAKEHPDWVKGKRFRLRIGRRSEEEEAVARGRKRSRFHFDRPLRQRLPRETESDLEPTRTSRENGWDIK